MAFPPSTKFEKIFQEILCITKPVHPFQNENWQPPTDVYETEDHIVIKMAVSGIRAEDVSIVLTGDTLVIRGKRLDPSEHKKVCFYLMEIRYGTFERSIVLPKNIDENHIEASYKDGFLQITIPKAQEASREDKPIKISL